MNPHESNERPVTDERLSAYFDGEASPEERAAVESLLDDSLAARRELDEIAQLSALLHSFPRESAPVELVANVQRQTDQIPLVARAVTLAVPARSLRREWTAAISAAIVTAVALFVMASVVDPTGSRGWNTVAQNDQATPGLATDMVEQAEAMNPASGLAGVQGGGMGGARYAEGTAARPLEMEAAPKLSAPTAAKALAGDGTSDAPTVANTSPEALFEAQQNRALGANLMLTDNGAVQNFYVSNPDFINGLKLGEVYQFVPQVADNGSNVAVIDLAVLDIERGVDQVQVLLARNSIQPRLAGQLNDLEKQRAQKLREQSKASGNEMVVVYTVGPGEQLAKTLEDMQQHPDLFFGWSSQPPVQLPSGEELAALKEDATSVKDAVAPTDKPTADKSGTAKQNADRQFTARRKETAAMDDNMDDEAKLAVNALLERNTYANYGNLNNNGIVNFNDSNTTNFGVRAVQQGVAGDGKPFNRAGTPAPAGAPSTVAAQPAKAQPSDPNNALPSTSGSRKFADEKAKGDSTAKKSGEQKQEADAQRELERRSYQITIRMPTDGVPLAEQQVPQLNRSNTLNYDNVTSRARRSVSNVMQQQAEPNSRASANTPSEANRVKVLFVLHPMPAPAAKPNP